MTSGPPARIDRPALERILQRAAELQAAERDVGEGLTTDEVLDLGREVGIPANYLRRAILEDQSRGQLAEAGSGLLNRTFGAADVAVSRVIAGEQDAIERALVRWMEKHELMVVQRHKPGAISWERDRGMRAALRRGMSSLEADGQVKYMLARADGVVATVLALEPGYCHVTLTASARSTRSGYVGGAATLTSAGLVAAGVLAVMTPFALLAVAPIPAGLGLAWVVSRSYRPVAERIHLGLERALDHAEGAGIKPAHQIPPRTAGLLEVITQEVRKALK